MLSVEDGRVDVGGGQDRVKVTEEVVEVCGWCRCGDVVVRMVREAVGDGGGVRAAAQDVGTTVVVHGWTEVPARGGAWGPGWAGGGF